MTHNYLTRATTEVHAIIMQKEHSASKVRYLTVAAPEAGQRIDNYLGKMHPNIPKSHIYRIIRTGQVRVNSGRIKATYKLKSGDQIRVPPVYDAQKEKNTVPDDILKMLESAVLSESDDFIALNKPAGLSVHGGSGLHFGIIEAFRQSRDDQRLELIHRLDRGTSGCLLIGKHLQAIRWAQDAFRQRTVQKRYTALLDGVWRADSEQVKVALQTNALEGGERKVVVSADGKQAISNFTTLETFASATLMSIVIETGRTHQIRVHAAHTGYPVIGDSKYGDSATNRAFRRLGFKRLYLHAEALELPALEDGQPGLRVTAPCDEHWQKQLASLRIQGSIE